MRAGRSVAATPTGNAKSPSGDPGVTSRCALATPGGRAQRELATKASRPSETSSTKRGSPAPSHLPAHPAIAVPTGSSSGLRWGHGGRNPAPENQRRSKPAEDPGSPEGCGPLTSLGSTWPAVGPSVCLQQPPRLSGTAERAEREGGPTCARSGGGSCGGHAPAAGTWLRSGCPGLPRKLGCWCLRGRCLRGLLWATRFSCLMSPPLQARLALGFICPFRSNHTGFQSFP